MAKIKYPLSSEDIRDLVLDYESDSGERIMLISGREILKGNRRVMPYTTTIYVDNEPYEEFNEIELPRERIEELRAELEELAEQKVDADELAAVLRERA